MEGQPTAYLRGSASAGNIHVHRMAGQVLTRLPSSYRRGSHRRSANVEEHATDPSALGACRCLPLQVPGWGRGGNMGWGRGGDGDGMGIMGWDSMGSMGWLESMGGGGMGDGGMGDGGMLTPGFWMEAAVGCCSGVALSMGGRRGRETKDPVTAIPQSARQQQHNQQQDRQTGDAGRPAGRSGRWHVARQFRGWASVVSVTQTAIPPVARREQSSAWQADEGWRRLPWASKQALVAVNGPAWLPCSESCSGVQQREAANSGPQRATAGRRQGNKSVGGAEVQILRDKRCAAENLRGRQAANHDGTGRCGRCSRQQSPANAHQMHTAGAALSMPEMEKSMQKKAQWRARRSTLDAALGDADTSKRPST